MCVLKFVKFIFLLFFSLTILAGCTHKKKHTEIKVEDVTLEEIKDEVEPPPPPPPQVVNFLLDSIFAIENIVEIKVRNIKGEHVLTTNELQKIKQLLKKARFAGGLLIKPGHIVLQIKLQNNKIVNSVYVYASTGQIHFDNARDKNGKTFTGTFILPVEINFDNYR